jgi:uncharacterized damage-inducible protein DinB
MLEMLSQLIAHKGHANAALLQAIQAHPPAAADPELGSLLHHVLLANRFWLLAVRGAPFVLDDESRRSDVFDGLVQRYAEMQRQEHHWLDTASEADLERRLTGPLIPGGSCSVGEALMQVCLHSHGHRAQCATRLRHLGGVPPATDFILWLTHRQPPAWPVVSEARGTDAATPT